MTMPTDRGYVTIGKRPDGLFTVSVYANRVRGQVTDRFAVYDGVAEPAIDTTAGLPTIGGVRVTSRPVEVHFDAGEGRVHVSDVSSFSF